MQGITDQLGGLDSLANPQQHASMGWDFRKNHLRVTGLKIAIIPEIEHMKLPVERKSQLL
jgi:hypothetical protein